MAETSMRERVWNAIVTVRDAYPRVPNDAPTDEVVDAILPLFEEAVTAERERFRAHLMEFVGDDGTLDQHIVANLAATAIRGGGIE